RAGAEPRTPGRSAARRAPPADETSLRFGPSRRGAGAARRGRARPRAHGASRDRRAAARSPCAPSTLPRRRSSQALETRPPSRLERPSDVAREPQVACADARERPLARRETVAERCVERRRLRGGEPALGVLRPPEALADVALGDAEPEVASSHLVRHAREPAL